MPDTVQDLIRKAAADAGIPASLALAVAEQESGFNPTLINPKKVKTQAGEEQAVGTFQFLPSTAKTLGIDPTDPRQNIDGGAKYLRQLMDKHKGDLDKVLGEYGGVKADKVYVPSVRARLAKFQGATETPAPVVGGRGAGPVGTGGGGGRSGGAGRQIQDPDLISDPQYPSPEGVFKAIAEPFDPRTPEGRVNLASTAGSALASVIPGSQAAAGPLAGQVVTRVAPWIARVLGPPVGAALAGGAERGVEQAIGTTPAEAAGPVVTGLLQGAYELGGQAFMWPIRRFAKAIFTPRIGRAAAAGLEANEAATAQTGREAVSLARQRAAEATEAARMMSQAETSAERARVAPSVQAAGVEATGKKIALREQTQAQLAVARRLATAQVAEAELDNAARVGKITKQYEAALGKPPSAAKVGEAVTAVVDRGIRGGPKGAAQIALDEAGKRVKAAAKAGPKIKFTPIKEALERMRAGVQPDELLGDATGEVVPVLPTVSARAPGVPAAPSRKLLSSAEITAAQEAFKRELAQVETAGLEGDVAHPLPKVLGLIQRAPEEISFDTAHKLKGLLDEAVNWDAKAKNHLQRLTKGVRIALRDQMHGFEPYDKATKAYAELIPLYEGKIGSQVIDAATHDPDALLNVFHPDKPLQAMALRDLLIDQAKAGGDPEAGVKAWDSVRAAFTHKNLIAGGIDGLEERVKTLVTQYPDFAKTVFHDEAGQQILTNLEQLGKAHRIASEIAAGDIKGVKASGAEAVKTATRGAARTTAVETNRINSAERAVRDRAAEAIRTAREQGAVRVREIAREGSEAIRDTQSAATEANAGATSTTSRFKGTQGVARPRPGYSQIGDAFAAANGSWFLKGRAIARLLDGPKANDILEWAAFSSKNTQRVTAALMGQMPDRAMSALVRDIGGVIAGPSTTSK